MRQVGRLSRPRQPICADAWPTGKPDGAGGDHERVLLVDVEVPARGEVVRADQGQAEPGPQEPVVDQDGSSARVSAQASTHSAATPRYEVARAPGAGCCSGTGTGRRSALTSRSSGSAR